MNSELFIQLSIILIDLCVGLFIGFRLGKDKSKKRNIILGLSTILVIAPILSVILAWLFSLIPGSVFSNDPLTGVAIIIITLPLFFSIGLGCLLSSISRKK